MDKRLNHGVQILHPLMQQIYSKVYPHPNDATSFLFYIDMDNVDTGLTGYLMGLPVKDMAVLHELNFNS